MSGLRRISDVSEFWQLVVASRLIDANKANVLATAFRGQFSDARPYGQTVTALGEFLVREGILTCWQFEKLRHGQYKGFFLDHYKLIDYFDEAENGNRYIALDTRADRICLVFVSPPVRDEVGKLQIAYRVEELPQ